jgi:hypothetical protein
MGDDTEASVLSAQGGRCELPSWSCRASFGMFGQSLQWHGTKCFSVRTHIRQTLAIFGSSAVQCRHAVGNVIRIVRVRVIFVCGIVHTLSLVLPRRLHVSGSILKEGTTKDGKISSMTRERQMPWSHSTSSCLQRRVEPPTRVTAVWKRRTYELGGWTKCTSVDVHVETFGTFLCFMKRSSLPEHEEEVECRTIQVR